MTQTHWKKLQNPDYLGAYSLEPGQDLIVTIKLVQNEQVKNERGTEECMVAHFEEKGVKPMIINTTNAKMIQKLLKTPYIEDWKGHKIQIYAANVKAFGEVMEALRVRNYKPKEAVKTRYTCEDCTKEISAFGSMKAEQVANYSKSKYGKHLCADCGKKHSEKETSNAN